MFRKINISKKKQFYQEIPIENMRYLNTRKENLNFHQKYSLLKTETAFYGEEDILKINITIGIWVRD